MSADRDIANAISDGINCIAAIASALGGAKGEGERASGPADPEWLEALDAMARAFDAVLAKQVMTSLVVGGDDVERIRRTRVLVSEWLAHGRASDELRALAEATLSFFGLPLDNAEGVTS